MDGNGDAMPGATEASVGPLASASGNQPFDPMRTVAAAAHPADPTAVQNPQDQREPLIAKSDDAATPNPGSLQSPASPYQVITSTNIPAAFAIGISSDLPGHVIANVSEAVYVTITGGHLLIPQGSHRIGRYDSQAAFGQRCVLMIYR